MQTLIDQIDQLDLPHLKADDLKWVYSTGRGLTTGSGRDKKFSCRRGVQTPIGDIEISIWIKAAEYIVERDGLQEELEHLRPFAISLGSSLHAKQLSQARHLDMCLSAIYRDPAWVGFVAYNQQYHPELLANTPMVEVTMGCCNMVCTIPDAHIHAENQTAHCPICGRWAPFTYTQHQK